MDNSIIKVTKKRFTNVSKLKQLPFAVRLLILFFGLLFVSSQVVSLK